MHNDQIRQTVSSILRKIYVQYTYTVYKTLCAGRLFTISTNTIANSRTCDSCIAPIWSFNMHHHYIWQHSSSTTPYSRSLDNTSTFHLVPSASSWTSHGTLGTLTTWKASILAKCTSQSYFAITLVQNTRPQYGESNTNLYICAPPMQKISWIFSAHSAEFMSFMKSSNDEYIPSIPGDFSFVVLDNTKLYRFGSALGKLSHVLRPIMIAFFLSAGGFPAVVFLKCDISFFSLQGREFLYPIPPPSQHATMLLILRRILSLALKNLPLRTKLKTNSEEVRRNSQDKIWSLDLELELQLAILSGQLSRCANSLKRAVLRKFTGIISMVTCRFGSSISVANAIR